MYFEEKVSQYDIIRKINQKYGVMLTQGSLSRHLRHCQRKVLDRAESLQETKKVVEEKLRETLNICDILKEQVQVSQEIIDRLRNKPEPTSSDAQAIRSLLAERRLTLKELRELTNSLSLKAEESLTEKEHFLKTVIDKCSVETLRRIAEETGLEELKEVA
jgi:hypothetical protein